MDNVPLYRNFQPGGADKVAAAANSLFNLAVIEKQHKRPLTARISQAGITQ